VVAVDYGVLDGEAHVRDRGMHVADRGLHMSDRLRASGCEAELMLHEVGRAQLVDDGVVAGGEALIKHAVHDCEGRVTDLHGEAPVSACPRP